MPAMNGPSVGMKASSPACSASRKAFGMLTIIRPIQVTTKTITIEMPVPQTQRINSSAAALSVSSRRLRFDGGNRLTIPRR